MLRLWKLGAVMLCVLVTRIAQVSAQDKPEPPGRATAYFPLDSGSRWVYRTIAGTVTMEMAGFETFGGVRCAVLKSFTGDRPRQSEHVRVAKDGVYRVGVGGRKLEVPLKLLPLPLPQAGGEWRFFETAGPKNDKKPASEPAQEPAPDRQVPRGRFVASRETVTVPAGKFPDAIRVSLRAVENLDGNRGEITVAGRRLALTSWYAKDVGLVKQTVELDGREVVLELERFVPGSERHQERE